MTLQERVFRFIDSTALHGATDDEIAAALKRQPQKASAKRQALWVLNQLTQDGRTRTSRTGQQETVWVTKDAVRRAYGLAPLVPLQGTSRRTDLASRLSYAAVKPTLAKRHMSTLMALAEYIAATGSKPTGYELLEYIKARSGAPLLLDVNSVRPNLTGLKDRGLVKKVGPLRHCTKSPTGKRANEWQLTDSGRAMLQNVAQTDEPVVVEEVGHAVGGTKGASDR